MVRRARVRSDRSGEFQGSPRPLMERPPNVSSGPLYRALYRAGLQRTGRGAKAVWHIPPDVMERYLGSRRRPPLVTRGGRDRKKQNDVDSSQ